MHTQTAPPTIFPKVTAVKLYANPSIDTPALCGSINTGDKRGIVATLYPKAAVIKANKHQKQYFHQSLLYI